MFNSINVKLKIDVEMAETNIIQYIPFMWQPTNFILYVIKYFFFQKFSNIQFSFKM